MSSAPPSLDPTACPVCRQPNLCRLATGEGYRGPCWCESIAVSPSTAQYLKASLPAGSCLCQSCLQAYARQGWTSAGDLKPGDYYFDQGAMVFTEAFLRRRGFCCSSGCRHCPYDNASTEAEHE